MSRYRSRALAFVAVMGVLCAVGCLGGGQEQETCELTIFVVGEGTVSLGEGSHTIVKDTVVQLQANPALGYAFQRWEGDVDDTAAAATWILVDTDKVVRAVFAKEDPTYLPNEMVFVPAGVSSNYWDYNYADIAVDYGLWMGKYPVTNANFVEFLNAVGTTADGSYKGVRYIEIGSSYVQIAHDGEGFHLREWEDADGAVLDIGNHPVVGVSWYGAAAYCNWLSVQEGFAPAYSENWLLTGALNVIFGYRLPEAHEWEYAGRGGAEGDSTVYAGSNILGAVGWYDANADAAGSSNLSGGRGTHAVGLKQPNELGIYDMSGNVSEWTNTVIAEFYLLGKGGHWGDKAEQCELYRASERTAAAMAPEQGFRVARTAFTIWIPPW